MTAYYNENEPYAADWLENLIREKLIPDGIVDRRSIVDVRPSDVKHFTQCHFFAGIGGWPYALRLAGWPDDREGWTGSCPCQPFSEIGRRQGFVDERDLWPDFFNLIEQCRPAVVFGEQVAEQALWFDRAATDLEGISYAFAGAVLPACCVDAPILRERFFFVACPAGQQVGLSGLARQQGNPPEIYRTDYWDRERHWSDYRTATCSDGKIRRIHPDVQFLDHGVSARIPKLRAIGGAIVPQVAAEFIIATRQAMSTVSDMTKDRTCK